MKTLTLKARFGLLVAFITVVNLLILAFVVFRLVSFEDRFHEFHRAGVELERQTLKVAAHTNYVSRLTRSIMLGDDLDKNLGALDKTIGEIQQSFDAMKSAVGAMTRPDAKGQFDQMVAAAEADTLAFVNDARDRMRALKAVERTPEALSAAWAEYQKAATPVANKARGSFKQLTEGAEAYLATLREQTSASLSAMRGILTAAQLLATLASVVLLIYLSRKIIGPISAAVAASRQMAQGDLTVRIPTGGADEGGLMLSSLRDMQGNIARIVTDVRQGAERLQTASAEIASGNQDLSVRTENQASALQQTVSSMEQLGATVQRNADNARTANELAQSASTVAAQGGEVVAQVVDTMRGINDSARRIHDIISVIDGIAFQTNILALNAAVEAARAGEHGRGFAVVASEVRSLAGRSAEAAKEIKALITESVNRVEQGASLVDQAGHTMEEVVAAIRRVTDIVGDISAASSSQSAGVGQVGQALAQMDQATQHNAALVEEMAAAAASLNAQAQQLVQAVAVFRLAGGEAPRLPR